jgi:thioredoxin reductase (NADPH)
VTNTVIESINGNGKVNEVVFKNLKTGHTEPSPVEGIFIFVGHEPNSQLFKDQLAMTPEGYLEVDSRLHTSVPGVFAAGEIHDNWFKQAITSAGFGCMAAMEAEKYLTQLT